MKLLSVALTFASIFGAFAAQPSVTIKWYSNANATCSNEGNMSTVTTTSAQCNNIADGVSYVVSCNSNTTGGAYRSCTDALCSTCAEPLNFDNNECLASDTFVGSDSAQFTCSTGDSSGAAPLSVALGGVLAVGMFAMALVGGGRL